jgi:hypothetical protein
MNFNGLDLRPGVGHAPAHLALSICAAPITFGAPIEMKTPRSLTAAAIGCGLALGLGGAGRAQDAAASAQPAPGGEAAHHWGERDQMRARFEAGRQRRLQTLHDALGLRPDQESAWQAYVADSKPPEDRGPGGWTREPGDEARAPLTAPQRLDRMGQRIAALQARLERRAATVKRFYAVLDQRQQKTFDALFSLGLRGRLAARGFGPGRRG